MKFHEYHKLAMFQGEYTRITVRQNLFLGGYPKLSQVSERVGTDKGYVGCIQHLVINGYRYDFRSGGIVGDSQFGLNVGEYFCLN